jgi:predicted CXXCH cytochrome family protein
MNKLIYSILLSVIFIFVSGCDKHTRYKVLTVFFTGVPPIDGSQVVMKKDRARGVKKKQRKKRRRLKSKVFVHGPKASGECFYCHDTARSQSFRRMKEGGVPDLGKIKPGRLIDDLEVLCIQCHTSKSAEIQYVQNMWVHGPVSTGNCTACHDYHQTKFNYMLFTDDSRDLCMQCHKEGFMIQSESHKNKKQCISCHNPHIGADRLLLRKDYDEIF